MCCFSFLSKICVNFFSIILRAIWIYQMTWSPLVLGDEMSVDEMTCTAIISVCHVSFNCKENERERDRQTDRERERQTERERDRQRETLECCDPPRKWLVLCYTVHNTSHAPNSKKLSGCKVFIKQSYGFVSQDNKPQLLCAITRK